MQIGVVADVHDIRNQWVFEPVDCSRQGQRARLACTAERRTRIGRHAERAAPISCWVARSMLASGWSNPEDHHNTSRFLDRNCLKESHSKPWISTTLLRS